MIAFVLLPYLPRQHVTLSPRCFAEPLSQQFHDGIDEVAPQVNRFRH
jgi:hypothetical protein